MALKWDAPAGVDLEDTLTEVWNTLDDEVTENPPLEQVTGMTEEELTKHAVEAVSTFVTNTPKEELEGPMALVEVYSLGFVVGMKYGERRSQGSVDPD